MQDFINILDVKESRFVQNVVSRSSRFSVKEHVKEEEEEEEEDRSRNQHKTV